MEQKLKHCPICSNDDIDTDEMDLLGTGDCCIHAICHKCGASAPVDKWNDRAESEELEAAKYALEFISNPVSCLVKEAADQGLDINGNAAVSLGNDANYLKEVASKALAKLNQGDLTVQSRVDMAQKLEDMQASVIQARAFISHIPLHVGPECDTHIMHFQKSAMAHLDAAIGDDDASE